MLNIDQITVMYAQKTVLKDFSLQINDDEIVSLIGPSGAGKSTLLKAITQLIPLKKGKVVQPKNQNKAVTAWIPQDYGLLPWKTVQQNINLSLQIVAGNQGLKQRQEQIKTMMSDLGLTTLANKYPNQLSGGQQQRVAIARAFILTPTLLLMDEPFSALDQLTRESGQMLFWQQWQQQPCATLLITHDIDEALYLGHRIVVMNADGQIQTMMTNPLRHISPQERRVAPDLANISQQLYQEVFKVWQNV